MRAPPGRVAHETGAFSSSRRCRSGRRTPPTRSSCTARAWRSSHPCRRRRSDPRGLDARVNVVKMVRCPFVTVASKSLGSLGADWTWNLLPNNNWPTPLRREVLIEPCSPRAIRIGFVGNSSGKNTASTTREALTAARLLATAARPRSLLRQVVDGLPAGATGSRPSGSGSPSPCGKTTPSVPLSTTSNLGRRNSNIRPLWFDTYTVWVDLE